MRCHENVKHIWQIGYKPLISTISTRKLVNDRLVQVKKKSRGPRGRNKGKWQLAIVLNSSKEYQAISEQPNIIVQARGKQRLYGSALKDTSYVYRCYSPDNKVWHTAPKKVRLCIYSAAYKIKKFIELKKWFYSKREIVKTSVAANDLTYKLPTIISIFPFSCLHALMYLQPPSGYTLITRDLSGYTYHLNI